MLLWNQVAFICSRFPSIPRKVRVRGQDSPLPEGKRQAGGKQDGAKHWTTRPDDVPGDGSTAGWDATTGQLPATFVPSAAAAAAVQFTPGEQHSAAAAAAAAKSTAAFSA